MNIVPITLKAANEYVAQHHRHHKPATGCKFCIGCEGKADSLSALRYVADL